MLGMTYNADTLAKLEEEGLLYTSIPSLEDLAYPPLPQSLLFPGKTITNF